MKEFIRHFLEYSSHDMKNLPSIVCIVTGKISLHFKFCLCKMKSILSCFTSGLFILGKGPLKEQFVAQVESERDQYKHVEFCFPWLDADDYPLLIGTACVFSFCKGKQIFENRLCGCWCKSPSIIE